MIRLTASVSALLVVLVVDAGAGAPSSEQSAPVARISFDNGLEAARGANATARAFGSPRFVKGLSGEALRFERTGSLTHVALTGEGLAVQKSKDFSVSFWIRTTIDRSKKTVLLSQKSVPDDSLRSQKQKGWMFGIADGTWSWNVGSGNRRLTYSHDNGQHMPINDGRWHQLAMSYDSSASLVRLFFDGVNWVTYNVEDTTGFDFSSDRPIEIGWSGRTREHNEIGPLIVEGRDSLQTLVDSFSALGIGGLDGDDLVRLAAEPEDLIEEKTDAWNAANPGRQKQATDEETARVVAITQSLMRNPYTIHQSPDFMLVAPLAKVYKLANGVVEVNEAKAKELTSGLRLEWSEFDVDELTVWDRTVTDDEVTAEYARFFVPVEKKLATRVARLTAGAFNIHHGGIHETVEEDGWDSRDAIADLIEREGIDVVMMQETYSNGDYIAAKLGYYFATTVDWDYLNQGANISVLSRYPIKEVFVPPGSPFMNVCARIALSESQDVYVMSNWYGMANFADVFEFHRSRFAESDTVPTIFGGDFNAVPHLDGGRSEASETLIAAGFTDAYRSLHPDFESDPAPTHRSGRRIDQIFYKGSGLRNLSTEVLSSWPSVFPSDHYLIKAVFELDSSTRP